MELHYLRTLKVITESTSFAEAAEKLNYTRSTVTFHVQQLEKEFGIPLFEKRGKKMCLTHEGKAILPYVETILNSYDQILICGKSEMSILRIAVPESLLTYCLQTVIWAFKEKMPLVDLQIQTHSCYDMNQLLINDKTDVAIHYDVDKANSNIIHKSIAKYPLTFFGSVQLSDEEKDFWTPNQKKDFGFIDIEIDGIYKHSLDKVLSDRNITLSNGMVLGSLAAIIQCVKMKLGVSVLPLFVVENELKTKQLQALDGELVPNTISVQYSYHKNKQISPAMRCLLDLIEEML